MIRPALPTLLAATGLLLAVVAIPPLGLALLLMLAMAGMGQGLLVLLLGRHGASGNVLERGALSMALGFLASGHVMFALSAMGWLHPVVMLGGLAALGMVGGVLGRGGWTEAVALPKGRGIVAVAGVLVGVGAAGVPSLFYDALVYHHAIPQHFLEEGGLRPMPWLVYSNFPLLFELNALPALALDSSGVAANLLTAGMGVALVAAVAAVTARVFSMEAAGFAALLAACNPLLTYVRVVPSSDVGVACFAVLAGLAWLRSMENARWLRVLWVLLAGAVFSKSSAGVQVVPVIGLLILLQPGLSTLERIGRVALTGVLPLLLNAPTWIKNWLYAGNPFMPVLHGVLGGEPWSEQQSAFMAADTHQAGPPWQQGLQAPALLLEVITGSEQLINERFAGAAWLLAMVVCFLVPAPLKERVRRVLAVTGVLLVLWLFTFPQGRFLGPALACGCIAGGAALAWLWSTRRVLVLAGLGVALGVDGMMAQRVIALWQGNWTEGLVNGERYVATHLDYPAAGAAVRDALGVGEHALMVGEARCFHLGAPCESSSVLDVPPLFAALQAATEPAEVAEWLRARRVGALVVRPHEFSRLAAYSPFWRLSDEKRGLLNRVLREHARPVFQTEGGQTVVFDLSP